MNMNDKNKKDETVRPMLSEIENTDIATLKKHKAKAAIPLRIGGIIFVAYMIAIVIMRYILQMQIPSDALWDCRGNVYYNCAHYSILCKASG